MSILIWGFYNQGNLGDDLMAVMVAELVKSIGLEPVIVSSNPRFREMGYATTNDFATVQPEAIILSGGAFFKKGSASKSSIENSILDLVAIIETLSIPVFGVSLGSDGITSLREASPARRAILNSPHFAGTTVRLRQDLALGLPRAEFLPDIVFTTAHFRNNFLKPRKSFGVVDEYFLINLSRRTALQFPLSIKLGRGHRKAVFLAHSGTQRVGGELALPFLPRVETDDMVDAIDRLGHSVGIMSSKLHPGIMALSMGGVFYSVSPRPKTSIFINESQNDGIIETRVVGGSVISIRMKRDINWQGDLFDLYKDYIARSLEQVL